MEEKQLEKLERFMQSVNEEVQEQIDQMLMEAKQESMQLQQSTEDETLAYVYGEIQEQTKEITANYQRETAQLQQKMRRLVLEHREALIGRIFENLKAKVCAFTETEAYESYLLSLLKDTNATEDLTVLIREKDQQFATKIAAALNGCKVETDVQIQLGGLTLFYPNAGCCEDRTLDTAFEEQRKQFSANYSLND